MGIAQSHTSKPFVVNDVNKYATFEDDWFAEGASRYAYRGKIYTVNGWWFERGEQCVVKVYNEEDVCPGLKAASWKADDRASLKAREMTRLFNIDPRNEDAVRIQVLIPYISKVETFATYKWLLGDPFPKTVRGSDAQTKENADKMVPKDASVAIEPLLQGQSVQFLSNSAYVNPDEDTLAPVAFSHFTYHESGGEILVTDLQGVHNQKSYVFTDPAVHSVEKHGHTFGHYGPTDLGIFGVIRFFLDHKCNSLCEGLLIPDISNIPDWVKGDLKLAIEAIKSRSGSTYTYALLNSGLTAERVRELHTNIAQAISQNNRAVERSQSRENWGFRDEFISWYSMGL